MAHPWDVDGGDFLLIWSIAVNILNKKLQSTMVLSQLQSWARGANNLSP